MIFKCYLCNKYSLWSNKKSYTLIVTSNDGEEELLTKRLCASCGDDINRQYEFNKQIADLEVKDQDE